MVVTLNRTPLNFKPLSWMLASAMICTLFLFYVDEGYYSFEWMRQGGAWAVFSVFVFLITCAQIILAFFASLFLNEKGTVQVSKWIAILPLTFCGLLGALLLII